MKVLVEIELTQRDLQALRHEIREQQTGHCPEFTLPINEGDIADAGTARAWIRQEIQLKAQSLVRNLETYETVKKHHEQRRHDERINTP